MTTPDGVAYLHAGSGNSLGDGRTSGGGPQVTGPDPASGAPVDPGR